MSVAVRVLRLCRASFAGRADDAARLIPVGFGDGPVLRLHRAAIDGQLLLSSPVRGNLRGSGATQACFLEMFLNLLAARAVGFQVLARIPLNLGCAILPDLQFVPELSHAPGKLGLIHGGSVLLGAVQLLRLDRAEFSVSRFRHVEEDDMGMQLRRGVAVNRPCGVVLELRSGPITRVLRWIVAAHSCLNVRLHLVDGNADSLAMCFPHPFVASNEGSHRHTLGRRECRVPCGSVAHGLDRLAVGGLVLMRKPLLDQLLAGSWVPAFRHPREVDLMHLAPQPEIRGETALPLAANVLLLGVVRLRTAGELLPVIPLSLPRTQRTRDGEHQSKYGISPTADSAWP